MTVHTIKEGCGSCIKLTSSEGPSFFLRLDYLELVLPEEIRPGAVFERERFDDIAQAGFAFAAERDALAFLGRSEHCRSMLEAKLAKKDHEAKAVKKALDFLERRKLLDDLRFARAWLHNRLITRAEGPVRLAGELAKRGIKREIIDDALDELLQNVSTDELFERALDKLYRSGKRGKKLEDALLRKGFDYRRIKNAEIRE
ncbi:regulatory protein RecX [Treponema sp. HNW]|uniref:regulatory protein RecX n=1 Tax=Treponema sp. HNW TaxID=3116654 RepID=UPI003D0CF08A